MKQQASKNLSDDSARASGSQTLLRGLDLLDAVAERPLALPELAARLGLSRSTTHRLANALVERRFLVFTPRAGYRLGPKLLDLGSRAQRQVDLVQIARPHMEDLAHRSEDTVHLGVRVGDQALYLDKIPGRRRIEISSRVGERQPLTTTGLGKALLLDGNRASWNALFAAEQAKGDADLWHGRMADYAAAGYAFDLEENEDRIRCVAAPVRGAAGAIVGAISVSGAAQYMDDTRMRTLSEDVRATAAAISAELGWSGN
jgi:DNA-binding IclR family transcriptional regulator